MKKARHNKATIVWFHSYKVPRLVQFSGQKEDQQLAGTQEGVVGSYCLIGTGSVEDDEKVMEVDNGDAYIT